MQIAKQATDNKTSGMLPEWTAYRLFCCQGVPRGLPCSTLCLQKQGCACSVEPQSQNYTSPFLRQLPALRAKKDAEWRLIVAQIICPRFKAAAERRQ